MSEQRGRWTRRDFLEMVGRAGGTAAVYETMVALGLLRTPDAYAGPPRLGSGAGNGQSVVILGAGVGGLCAAYELRKAGFTVDILEATERTGGRSYTVRRGDVIRQIGRVDQVCRFDDKLYLNAGPGRIPYHHQAVLDYCRELGVELEVYIMETRAALFQTPHAFGGQPVRNRQVANDTRGYVAELLAKAVRKDALNDDLKPGERQDLLDLLVTFGQIDRTTYRYDGSSRSGYKVEPGVEDPGEIVAPLPLQGLLDSRFWRHRFYQPEDYEWQPTLYQPVGGMDHFAHAFADRVKDSITPHAEVLRVHNAETEVQVLYRDRQTGRQREKRADFCISNIPLPLLVPLVDNDTFDARYKEAVRAVPFAHTCKVGWQAEERFWERRDDKIYGGISWIDDPITQMWYPSAGIFQKKGVLTGAYNFAPAATVFGDRSLDDRLRVAREGAERLHPDFAKYVNTALGLSIAWQQVPFQQGGWADWDFTKPEHQAAYDRLLDPDKRFIVCGDQLSYLSGWQEGAVLSAHHAIERMTRPQAQLQARPAVPAARRMRRSARNIVGAGEE